MINLPALIKSHWDTNPALPPLYIQYVPQSVVDDGGFPLAQFEFTGFGRRQTNSPLTLDIFKTRFAIFHENCFSAFDLGQKALDHMYTFDNQAIYNTTIAPEEFATPVEAGKKIVWAFKFTIDFKLSDHTDQSV